MNAQTAIYSVTGYFSTRFEATSAIAALKATHFEDSQIIVALRPDEQSTAKDVTTGSTSEKVQNLWGDVVAFFAATSTSDLYDKERDGSDSSCVVGNPVHGGYAEASADFRKSITALNVSEEHAKYFSDRFNQGREAGLVTVAARGREDEAAAVLERFCGDVGRDALSITTVVADDGRQTGEVIEIGPRQKGNAQSA